MNPQPGEIWLADLGLAAKMRPVVIVSRQDPDALAFALDLERASALPLGRMVPKPPKCGGIRNESACVCELTDYLRASLTRWVY
jgi:hypothetical protein